MASRRPTEEDSKVDQGSVGQEPSASNTTERIQIWSPSIRHWRFDTAVIAPGSACNIITFPKLTALLGPHVEYSKAGDNNPHQHPGFRGMISLRIEHTGYEWGSNHEFCILQDNAPPIVMRKSSKPDNREPLVLPMGNWAASSKADKKRRQENREKAKKREGQKSKDKDKKEEYDKDEEGREQLDKAAQKT
ncbi:uncharacterized protein Z519_11876 [Cladophialophora bantiana CBS 173.52]|uniref:Uncharacterized protein n=1 Tax=Cladophialophora bantiana (strain ATCC 10958 / CBS 173.52 / CDC B-1940 / NIH 8579) TaxID=1442370 RepID=A0A0D2FLJ2_CLAB1|nr:uncharacterized protein Z519_11876 [Cladophialophora bantiana CBS 173.52]KIW87552.1 hypothetical protein Z519_11876 [Cladophialophora bantiana CBS 173.52]